MESMKRVVLDEYYEVYKQVASTVTWHTDKYV